MPASFSATLLTLITWPFRMSHDDGAPRSRRRSELDEPHTAKPEIDRIEAPAEEAGEDGSSLCRSASISLSINRLDAVAAGPVFCRAESVPAMVAEEGRDPDAAGHGMRMALDEPRQQDEIAEAIILPCRPPRLCVSAFSADREAAAVPNRHMVANGQEAIHGEDLARPVDDRCVAHERSRPAREDLLRRLTPIVNR